MLSLAILIFVSGCNGKHFDAIDYHQSFVASLNIQEPSIQFFNKEGGEIANWPLEKAYTGGVLVQQDTLLLYGHQLKTADLYEISSGKLIAEIETGEGTTNGIYASEQKKIFLTNSKSNAITSYDVYGKEIGEQKLGNYPMSMEVNGSLLYVVNYKDTKLSIVNIEDLSIQDEWEIERSSHGMAILPEMNTLWLGGHGEGSHPNQTVDVLDLTTGEKIEEINMPLMPIGFYKTKDDILVISHGENILYIADETGDIKWQKEIAANPFAVAEFQDQIIVAGYDDHKLYFIDEQQVTKEIAVGKGPFQLLVREWEK